MSDVGSSADELEQLRRQVAELTEALELRDEFIAIVGHELRNPLAPLYLKLQLLKDRLTQAPATIERDPVLQTVVGISEHLDRFMRLLERVFDITRIGTDQLVLKSERMDLSEAVRAWLVSHEAELRAARCEVHSEIEPGVIGNWDCVRIEQILDNVIGNALRYGAGQPIEIQLTRCKSDAVLAVRDHGIGIDPADHARVFQRYVRGERGRRGSGLGVGLWVVQNICRAFGGSVEVDSQLGCGATFTVKLPIG